MADEIENDKVSDKIKGFFREMIFDKAIGGKFKEKFGEDLPVDIKSIDAIFEIFKKSDIRQTAMYLMIEDLYIRNVNDDQRKVMIKRAIAIQNENSKVYEQLVGDVMKAILIIKGHQTKMKRFEEELIAMNEVFKAGKMSKEIFEKNVIVLCERNGIKPEQLDWSK